MDNMTRKELQAQYKEREITGGVYAVENMINNKMLLQSTTNINGRKNRFDFSQKMDSCIYQKIKGDWAQYGSSAFEFNVLETLKKTETQSMAEFKNDVEVLLEMWREKLSDKELY